MQPFRRGSCRQSPPAAAHRGLLVKRTPGIGYVRLTSVPGKLIVLTDPGKRLIDEAIGRHVANKERLLLSLSEAEQETLSALFKKLIAGL